MGERAGIEGEGAGIGTGDGWGMDRLARTDIFGMRSKCKQRRNKM